MIKIINREEGIAMALDTLEKGRAEGLEKGHAEKALEIARNSLGQGLPVELIHKITGLDIETIQSLK